MKKITIAILAVILIVSLSGCISAGMQAEITYRVIWTDSTSIDNTYDWYVAAAVDPEIEYDNSNLPTAFVYNQKVTPDNTLYSQSTIEVNLSSSRDSVIVYVYADVNADGKLDSGDIIHSGHWYPDDTEDPEYILKFFVDF
jgi:hypothetical protein